MKKDKLKKYSIRFGITFLIVIAFLTYFSGTIDNMLLPQVKVSDVAYGTINGEQSQDDRYLNTDFCGYCYGRYRLSVCYKNRRK